MLEAYGWQDLLAKGPPCSGGLRPSIANEEAPSLSSNGIDAHRATLQSISSAIEQELLTRLVALNHERAAEEKRGLVRWLRPDYQAPDTKPKPEQKEIDLGSESSSLKTEHLKLETLTWPTALSAQVTAIRKLLPAIGPDAEALSARFGRKSKKRSEQIAAILATLKALGHIS